MMNLNYVVVDVNAGFLSIYAFCDPENAAAEIAKAQKVAAKEAEHFSIMSVPLATTSTKSPKKLKMQNMSL